MNKTVLISIAIFGLLSKLLLIAFPTSANSSLNAMDISTGEKWWSTDWKYRIKITIDSSLVNESLTNFPVLVRLNDSRIDWAHVNSTGQDIRFLNSAQTELLSYEIEKWNYTNSANIWVKLDSVDNTSDTEFYMYYGNTEASDAQDASNVWDASFMMVQHLQEGGLDGTTDEVVDSTSNGNNGKGYPTDGNYTGPVGGNVGQVDGGVDLDGNDDYVEVSYDDSLHSKEITIKIWAKPRNLEINLWSTLLRYGGGTSQGYHIVEAPITQQLQFHIRNESDTVDIVHNSGWAFPSANKWYYIVVTYSQTNERVQIFVDGDKKLEEAHTQGVHFENKAIHIGCTWGAYNFWNGTIDEVRISNKSRSEAWVKACYESERDNLLGFGPAEEPDTTSPEITVLSPGNMTYATGSVPLTFTVNETCSWMGYSFDGRKNVTITGSINLTELSNGSHSIIMYANDIFGNMGSSNTVYFTADIPPPVASFTYSPISPAVNEKLTFSASISYDLKGTVVSYEWDLGDGDTGMGVIIDHKYSEPGDYNVTLTVKDAVGNTDTYAITIAIKETSTPILLWIIAVTIVIGIVVVVATYLTKIKKEKHGEKSYKMHACMHTALANSV